jgi:hypothetical protein
MIRGTRGGYSSGMSGRISVITPRSDIEFDLRKHVTGA